MAYGTEYENDAMIEIKCPFKEATLLMKVRKSNSNLDILIRTKNIKKFSNK
ncbi:hypothetical protein DDB_G0280305 [Dictyostelium discoideum AX4]|uniref:Putative uncharacterized protein DDB_G0280305 n=1 Tax=Dictyostelium discoideum TaxID=44689 RepID=Y6501_DICDI|nr:hypothetical protein DDB_G0280305 [Dictyostelium discoideum AX4]Q54VJ3.1 RecName: Full=Putative uncharacterized protein DDB_G0280305 [Dictyostelium discoideum]EAL67379.1 hypothetical protein DDB_G0280305 [Dictyostelium discoideum AX4]|eukprot:XP_641362.1 hypothetical protein DDB_G0280305 [Dictyostelium discoideum AX4]